MGRVIEVAEIERLLGRAVSALHVALYYASGDGDSVDPQRRQQELEGCTIVFEQARDFVNRGDSLD